MGGRERLTVMGGRERLTVMGGRERLTVMGDRERLTVMGGRERLTVMGGRETDSNADSITCATSLPPHLTDGTIARLQLHSHHSGTSRAVTHTLYSRQDTGLCTHSNWYYRKLMV